MKAMFYFLDPLYSEEFIWADSASIKGTVILKGINIF